MPTDRFTPAGTLSDNADALAQTVADVSQDVRASVSDAARTASARIENSRLAAADRLAGAATTVRHGADELPAGARVQRFAHAAADRLSTTADYLRSHDSGRIRADVETMVKNNPGPALLIAAAFGFLLSRALTRE